MKVALMKPQSQQALQPWADGFTSLSNYLLLETAWSITGPRSWESADRGDCSAVGGG